MPSKSLNSPHHHQHLAPSSASAQMLQVIRRRTKDHHLAGSLLLPTSQDLIRLLPCAIRYPPSYTQSPPAGTRTRAGSGTEPTGAGAPPYFGGHTSKVATSDEPPAHCKMSHNKPLHTMAPTWKKKEKVHPQHHKIPDIIAIPASSISVGFALSCESSFFFKLPVGAIVSTACCAISWGAQVLQAASQKLSEFEFNLHSMHTPTCPTQPHKPQAHIIIQAYLIPPPQTQETH